MRVSRSLGRILAKPASLWVLFAAVLFLAAGGLILLSRHALRLSAQQSESQAREELLQNLRVSLWRLDSRLGPFIATLHDPSLGNRFYNDRQDQFVIQRFNIETDRRFKGQPFRFVATSSPELNMMGMGTGSISIENSESNWNRLTQTIPVASVVDAVKNLIPAKSAIPNNSLAQTNVPSRDQSLIQSYSVAPQQQAANPRGQRELVNRDAVVQNQFAINQPVIPQRKAKGEQQLAGSPDVSTELKLMPVWIEDNLVIVRAARTSSGQLEGAWIDWPALRESLANDIADLIPGVRLTPVRKGDVVDPERTLAAIPAMVVPPRINSSVARWSPTHTALTLAWCALLAAASLAAFALSRLIALSERRASFVSAVTHELRTPLTTFRLYSDLLARDMIPDPSDRKEYLQTLRREADRLTHLVDNVLRYSKLQQTSKQAAFERVTLSEWLRRIEPRMTARLSAASMTFVLDQDCDGIWSTDPPAMEQVLFNLIDNAAKYAQEATDRRVHLSVSSDGDALSFTVSDHGPGVPAALQATIFRPFAKSAERAAETAAGVGLGLALARQTCHALGGRLTYLPMPGGGASFRAVFPSRFEPDGC
ncbi:MAG: sensor histidine kinase [Rubripirellula sp.]